MSPQVLYVGAFDVAGLVRRIDDGAAPANHAHAMTQLRALGLTLRTLPTDAGVLRGGLGLQRRLWAALSAQDRPAAVVAHSHYALRTLAWIRRFARQRDAAASVPLAAFVHSMAARPWDRAWLKGLDLLMPLTRLAEAQLQAMDLPAAVVPVPYGADLDFYPPLAADGPRDLVLSVGVCGRDFGTLIAAAPRIARPVHIVGRVSPAQRANALSCGVQLHSNGDYDLPFSELLTLYRRAACVVVSTHGSAHPYGVNALVEAMAMGCPVVVTRGPALDLDPVTSGFGLHVPAHNGPALAQAVNRIVCDPWRVQRLGLRAREIAQAQASARHMSAAIARGLQRVIPDSAGAAA